MKVKTVFVMIGMFLLSSCSAWNGLTQREDRETSSLVEYLYSGSDIQTIKPETPTLNLPVKVGIAFVPSRRGSIHAKDEYELLEKVKQSFDQYDYIDRIEIIPGAYLATGKGFTTVEQVARLYDVDVMALVSYDQVSRSSLNSSSFLYLTIVGAFVIPGNNNLTQTFIDTSVFDIKTRKLLFRAPGVDKVKSYDNAVGASNDADEESIKSFHNAVADMTDNLDRELSRFKGRVKKEKIARVSFRSGYSGGGSFGVNSLVLLSLLFGFSVRNWGAKFK